MQAVLCVFSQIAVSADAEIIQRLERIERLLQSQGLLDMLQQIEALQQEVNTLHGDIEFQNHTLEQIKKRQRDLYTDIDQRLQRIERAGAGAAETGTDTIILETVDSGVPPLQTIEPVQAPVDVGSMTPAAENALSVEVVETAAETVETVTSGAQEAVAEVTTETTQVEADPVLTTEVEQVQLDPVQIRAQYQQAFKLLKQSQYEQAIKAFREFLTMNPRSEYSDNAQYWLGEAYYVTRQFELALEEYNKLLQNFPESKKLTHSLLKIGFCYYEMGQPQEARLRLENLRQQHPGTTAARLAEDRLKKIAMEEPQQVSESTDQ